MDWALTTSELWIIMPDLVREPSREDDVIVGTIIRGSSTVIPVRMLNGFFAPTIFKGFLVF